MILNSEYMSEMMRSLSSNKSLMNELTKIPKKIDSKTYKKPPEHTTCKNCGFKVLVVDEFGYCKDCI